MILIRELQQLKEDYSGEYVELNNNLKKLKIELEDFGYVVELNYEFVGQHDIHDKPYLFLDPDIDENSHLQWIPNEQNVMTDDMSEEYFSFLVGLGLIDDSGEEYEELEEFEEQEQKHTDRFLKLLKIYGVHMKDRDNSVDHIYIGDFKSND